MFRIKMVLGTGYVRSSAASSRLKGELPPGRLDDHTRHSPVDVNRRIYDSVVTYSKRTARVKNCYNVADASILTLFTRRAVSRQYRMMLVSTVAGVHCRLYPLSPVYEYYLLYGKRLFAFI
jgi:hypothetical protein